MGKPILLTSHAYADLDSISSYLAENWSISVLENFLALYEAKIKVIAEFPSRYPLIHPASGLRRQSSQNIISFYTGRNLNILRSSAFLIPGRIRIR